jgi:hypothetical protein
VTPDVLVVGDLGRRLSLATLPPRALSGLDPERLVMLRVLGGVSRRCLEGV